MNKWLIILAAMIALSPAVAMADNAYTFIKVDCNSASHSLVLNAFFDWDEAGMARLKRNEDNTYFFNDIAKTHKEVQCDLGNRHVLSFVGLQDQMNPRSDNLKVFLDHQHIPLLFYLQSQITITLLSEGDLNVEVCPLGFRNEVKDKQCTRTHIVPADLTE